MTLVKEIPVYRNHLLFGWSTFPSLTLVFHLGPVGSVRLPTSRSSGGGSHPAGPLPRGTSRSRRRRRGVPHSSTGGTFQGTSAPVFSLRSSVSSRRYTPYGAVVVSWDVSAAPSLRGSEGVPGLVGSGYSGGRSPFVPSLLDLSRKGMNLSLSVSVGFLGLFQESVFNSPPPRTHRSPPWSGPGVGILTGPDPSWEPDDDSRRTAVDTMFGSGTTSVRGDCDGSSKVLGREPLAGERGGRGATTVSASRCPETDLQADTSTGARVGGG